MRAVLTLLLLCIACLLIGRRAQGWSSAHALATYAPHPWQKRVCFIIDVRRVDTAALRLISASLESTAAASNLDLTVLSVSEDELPAEMASVGPARRIMLPRTRHVYDASAAAATSFQVLEWLREVTPPFDHIVFHSAGGVGYYSLVAREVGIALNASRISILSSLPGLRRRPSGRRIDGGAGVSLDELEEDYMQRSVAARADAMITSNAAMRVMRARRWRMPKLHAYLDPTTTSPLGVRDVEEGEDAAVSTPSSSSGGPLLNLWAQLPALPSNRSDTVSALKLAMDGLGDGDPLVTVCVVHHERGPLLMQTLQSIREQTLDATRVQAVVVDDGSESAAATATLKEIEHWPEFRTGRWLLLRRPSRYLGASRNEAARHAQGRFLYFLDDDNCLKRHSLLTLVTAAQISGAHVLTSFNEKWPSLQPPPAADETTERWLPLGDAAVVGMFKNCFGDSAALVRRSTFFELGGFTEDRNVGHEDWELWALAVLRGYKLRVVPEALYWYRLAGGGMLGESIGRARLAKAQRNANYARNIRPYLKRLAAWPEAQEAVLLAQGLYLWKTQ